MTLARWRSASQGNRHRLRRKFRYRGWRIGELKAWQEFITARGHSYEYLAFSDQSVSLRLT
jgi:hypothetical protein